MLGKGTVTIINGMNPHSIGRALGVGLRIAGRMAGQRVNAAVQGSPAPSGAQIASAGSQVRSQGKAAGQVTLGVARGVGGFLRPFRRLGSILLLEVTGAFFFLFVVVFASFAWKNRAGYLQGPGHRDFLVSTVLMALFLYLSVSSFWRARRK